MSGRPLLDIASYARRGPGRRDRLSPAEVAHISRTVRRVPEAVVKVLPMNSSSLGQVGRHADYIGRDGKLELETDDGRKLGGRNVASELLDDWDLDLEEHRRTPDLIAGDGRKPPKLVLKLMFSMPPGTSPEGVLAATRNFMREEFGLKHRYAFVLHTDEPHPHVHAMVKAVGEDGVRLHITKATLREWRQEFARQLRDRGIAANATERAVRGQPKAPKADPIDRAARRGQSIHMLERAHAAAKQMRNGQVTIEPGKERLLETRRDVDLGWRQVIEQLDRQGQHQLADSAVRFVERLKPPRTENELLIQALSRHTAPSQPERQEPTR
jgi:hypothetical protein